MEKTIEIKISKKAILFLLAIWGFIATIALAVVYNNANFNPAAGPSFCTDANNPVVKGTAGVLGGLSAATALVGSTAKIADTCSYLQGLNPHTNNYNA